MKKGSLCILHTESSSGWGGQETRILQEAIGLERLGARVIILCQPDSGLEKKAKEAGIDLRRCPIRSSIDLSAIWYIMGLIRDEDVDIVNTHSGKDSLVAAVASRLSKTKPKIVRTRHLALPITSRITYSLLPHRVVTVSRYVRKYLISRKGISEDKVVSIPTGIDLKRFDPDRVTAISRDVFNIPPDAPLVGTVAILRRKKGHHLLLDSIPVVVKEFPEAVFLFVGDGPQRGNIERKISELGIKKNVRLTGMRRDIPEILKAMELFVLPSLEEALGTSFLEAMAMRKPVIGTMVGGIAEVVKDGVTGVLVEPEDSNAIAEAIIRLLKDRDRMRKMGVGGRRVVEEEYGVDMMSKRLFDLYLSLIERS